MGPETAIALGVVQAGLTAAGAIQQNNAVKRSLASSARSAASNAAQIRDQSRLEASKTQREADRARARARVLLASSGRTDGDLSAIDILSQASFDEAMNLSIIDQNRANAVRSNASAAEAQQASIASQYQNPILATLQGMIGGVQTGLLLNQGFSSLTASASPQTTPIYNPSQTEFDNWMRGNPVVR